MKKKERYMTIYHKSKSILYFDYDGLDNNNEKEFIDTIDAAMKFLLSKPTGQLLLLNVENAYTNSKIIAHWKNAAVLSKPHTKKMAILGVTGVKAVLLKGVMLFSKMDIKQFSSHEKALDWLVL